MAGFLSFIWDYLILVTARIFAIKLQEFSEQFSGKESWQSAFSAV